MTFLPNPAIGEELKFTLGVEHAVESVAEKVAEAARQLAPYDPADDPEGHIRDSISVEDGPEGSKRVVVDNPHWLFPEFGTSTMAAEPYLRPAISRARGL